MSSELVTLTIDGREAKVPKGTNLIEAALTVGIDIPYYCYHRHLSVVGNCRMCQVEVEGMPKMTIGCNTGAQEGMVVKTQLSSERTREAQRSTLEFLLINHPLDCTVCDQAGHCKLQDYYYEYNAKPSRFIEEKVHKVKAEPFGPEVIYDGERCIVCTRCVRFCEEITKTNELGLFNRGDKAVIGIHPGKELNNPLSGCVVDLCPVGALTHRRWRFNTRIWYTNEEESVCPGCSTGCSAKVACRDGEVVQVKGRLNSAVNQEWMCDEGRYGFGRFQPAERLSDPLIRKGSYLEPASWDEALAESTKLGSSGDADSRAVILSPFLTLEEMWLAVSYAEKVMGLDVSAGNVVVQMRKRELTEVEAVLISPDYAPNARAAHLLGVALAPDKARDEAEESEVDWREFMQKQYETLLNRIRAKSVKEILIVGDRAILDDSLDQSLIEGILAAEVSVSLSPRAVLDIEESEAGAQTSGEAEMQSLGAHQLCKVLLPGRTVNEKEGIFVNADLHFQRLRALLPGPFGSIPEWILIQRMSKAAGKALLKDSANSERSVFRTMVKEVPAFQGLTLKKLGEFGLSWDELSALKHNSKGDVSDNTAPNSEASAPA